MSKQDRFAELGIIHDTEIIKLLQEENKQLKIQLEEKIKELEVIKKTFEEVISNISAISHQRDNLFPFIPPQVPVDFPNNNGPIWIDPDYIRQPYNPNNFRPYGDNTGRYVDPQVQIISTGTDLVLNNVNNATIDPNVVIGVDYGSDDGGAEFSIHRNTNGAVFSVESIPKNCNGQIW